MSDYFEFDSQLLHGGTLSGMSSLYVYAFKLHACACMLYPQVIRTRTLIQLSL